MSYSLSLTNPWRTVAMALGCAFLLSGFIGVQNASAADVTPPTVGTPTFVAPAYAHASTTINATYSDTGTDSGLAGCKLVVNGTEHESATLSSSINNGTASVVHIFPSAGSYDLNMRCWDLSSNTTTSMTLNLNLQADANAPTVSGVTPITAVRGASTTFSVSYADVGTGVNNCQLYVQQSSGSYTAFNMTETGGAYSGVASYTYVYTTSSAPASSYGQYATCTDVYGNVGTGAVTAVSISNPVSDVTAPEVSSVGPLSAIVNSGITITANYSDAVGVTSCGLYIDGNLIGTMDRTGTTSGTASRSHNFSAVGTYSTQVRCSDAAGNTGMATASISVNTGVSMPYVRRLIKLVCPSGVVDVNHPCKAVYYVGSDAKRHAFPNEKVYFTWYTDFANIIELDSTTMSQIALGKNVVYRPGTRMVKFTTLNRTYAVSRYGTLRWVTSESVAIALYGADWNRMIDDISDAFYTNYTFGADINNASQYNPASEASSVTTIDENL